MSHNGTSFHGAEIGISMCNLNRIISIDKEEKTVTCEAGVRIETLLEDLEKHGLTLHNLPSITKMTMGGLVLQIIVRG